MIKLRKTKEAEHEAMRGTVAYSMRPWQYNAHWEVVIDGSVRGYIRNGCLISMTGSTVDSGALNHLRRRIAEGALGL